MKEKNSAVSNKETEEQKGHLHPLTHITNETVRIFSEFGFSVALGPEIETEYNNFDALNIPSNHPARDLWDTFWLEQKSEEGENLLLRTHTSPVQIRYMKEHEPPLAVIAPGKTFRYEATDATHETQFHQIEGLMVGKDINLANLKGVLETFLKHLFSKNVHIRLRPSYFPFVEPGLEVDMSCFRCNQKGCSLCKYSGWIEIMGAGMVHPQVLQNGGVDSREWQGFAFGVGVDRLAMLKFGIDDIRLFYNGDLRLTQQF